jgi:hypothetical protein
VRALRTRTHARTHARAHTHIICIASQDLVICRAEAYECIAYANTRAHTQCHTHRRTHAFASQNFVICIAEAQILGAQVDIYIYIYIYIICIYIRRRYSVLKSLWGKEGGGRWSQREGIGGGEGEGERECVKG